MKKLYARCTAIVLVFFLITAGAYYSFVQGEQSEQELYGSALLRSSDAHSVDDYNTHTGFANVGGECRQYTERGIVQPFQNKAECEREAARLERQRKGIYGTPADFIIFGAGAIGGLSLLVMAGASLWWPLKKLWAVK